MNYILFDDPFIKESLLPLTYFRPVSEVRCGILTMKEKWEKALKDDASILSNNYLQEKFPVKYSKDDNVYINSAIFPTIDLVKQIKLLKSGQKLVNSDGFLIALKSDKLTWNKIKNFTSEEVLYDTSFDFLKNTFDIFKKNASQIKLDFEVLTRDKTSQKLSETNIKIGNNPIFIEPGAVVEAVTFNTDDGPVYIGKNVKILEGSLIRGPFAALENSVVKMGAKIYGGTTLGPSTKAGGEIKDTVFFGYTNKGHDGYLGDSVIAEWCNLGADTNNSNLKNNYSNVKLWHYPSQDFIDTELQFCGLIMGDHSKSGIATMFNTGTVVGVSSNVFGGDYQPKFFPSFKWGGQSYTDYLFDKVLEVADAVMKRRHKSFDEIEQNLFEAVYKLVKQKENLD